MSLRNTVKSNEEVIAMKQWLPSIRTNPFEAVRQSFEKWLPARREEVSMPSEPTLWPALFSMTGGPAIDVEEDDDTVRVTAELPGLSEKDFTVEVTGQRLVLRGEKKDEREEKDKAYYYAERSYGSFSRAVALPCEVEVARADANYKDGVLRVTLPKSETAKARRVRVNVK